MASLNTNLDIFFNKVQVQGINTIRVISLDEYNTLSKEENSETEREKV